VSAPPDITPVISMNSNKNLITAPMTIPGPGGLGLPPSNVFEFGAARRPSPSIVLP
jgi:hypothetical protein